MLWCVGSVVCSGRFWFLGGWMDGVEGARWMLMDAELLGGEVRRGEERMRRGISSRCEHAKLWCGVQRAVLASGWMDGWRGGRTMDAEGCRVAGG